MGKRLVQASNKRVVVKRVVKRVVKQAVKFVVQLVVKRVVRRVVKSLKSRVKSWLSSIGAGEGERDGPACDSASWVERGGAAGCSADEAPCRVGLRGTV